MKSFCFFLGEEFTLQAFVFFVLFVVTPLSVRVFRVFRGESPQAFVLFVFFVVNPPQVFVLFVVAKKEGYLSPLRTGCGFLNSR